MSYVETFGPHQIAVVTLRGKPGANPRVAFDNHVQRHSVNAWGDVKLVPDGTEVKFRLEDWTIDIATEHTDTYKRLRTRLDHETAVKAINALNSPLPKSTVQDGCADPAGCAE